MSKETKGLMGECEPCTFTAGVVILQHEAM
jgi:hypothetical protein